MFELKVQGYKPLWLSVIDYVTAILLCLGILLSLSFNLYTWVRKKHGGYVKLQPDLLTLGSAKEEFSSRLLANIEDLGDEDGESVNVRAFWGTVR
jgi:arginine/ornithine N-succinyltransferase beta subunit